MSKTYSCAFLGNHGVWLTNWNEYFQLSDINFDEVEELCNKQGNIAYGYYYGEKSGNLTSDKCRTIVKTLIVPEYTIESALKILLDTGGRIFYTGLDGQTKSLKIKWEQVGYTFQFGQGFDDKIVSRRWYVNGESDLINFLQNNLGLKSEKEN